MQNDFENKDFWVEKDQFNNKKYYIRMYGRWIEIPKEVYAVYKNSYQKMYRMLNKESDLVDYYGDIDIVTDFHMNFDPLERIIQKDNKIMIHSVMMHLAKEELVIIKSIYFDDMTEQELAIQLGISQQMVNYKKNKILKKLKMYLLNSI